MTSLVPVQATAGCVLCGSARYLHEFAPKPGTELGRDPVCRDCRENHTNRCKAERRNRELRQRMAEAVVSLGRTQGAPQVSEVVETLLARFGGLPKFCELYHEQIDLAAKTKPGSKSVLDALYAVVKMVQAANQQVSPLDMSMLTDDDLARIVEEKLAPHSVVTEVTL